MWTWIFIIALLGVALAAGAVWLRSVRTGQSISDILFAPKPEKRLGVLEMTAVDGRRRLVLVRRDDVEHLIMIGGPVDVVVETNIGTQQPIATQRTRGVNGFGNANGSAVERDPPPFGRQARTIAPQPPTPGVE